MQNIIFMACFLPCGSSKLAYAYYNITTSTTNFFALSCLWSDECGKRGPIASVCVCVCVCGVQRWVSLHPSGTGDYLSTGSIRTHIHTSLVGLFVQLEVITQCVTHLSTCVLIQINIRTYMCVCTCVLVYVLVGVRLCVYASLPTM